MELKEARELVSSPLWPKVRDRFLATGEIEVYPAGDIRRLAYLDAETRAKIDAWVEGLVHAAEWKKVVDGAQVRALKERWPGVYPEVFRYTAYFAKWDPAAREPEMMFKLLKLLFPEAYELCCS